MPWPGARRFLLTLLIVGVIGSAVPLAGCRMLLLRLPEPRGAHQASPVDPRQVEGLGPWVEDRKAGLVASSPGLDVRDYQVLVVEPFTVNPADIADDDDHRVSIEIRRALHQKLIARLREAGVFPAVIDGATSAVPDGTGQGLRLQGEISRFDLGSRSLRFFAGFGAGRTKLQVEIRFVEVGSGRAVLAIADRRVASKGLFGGDSQEFLLDSVEDFTRALAAYVKSLVTRASGAQARHSALIAPVIDANVVPGSVRH